MSVCVSVFVQSTSFCQSAGRDINSHLVTGLVLYDKNKVAAGILACCQHIQLLLKKRLQLMEQLL